MKLLIPFLPPLAIGAASGLLAALCGVGGGIIMVPAFVMFLGLPHKVAVATSMAVIVPTAIAATAQHFKNDLVDWRVFLSTAIAASLMSFVAADYVKKLSNETLTRVFAVVIIVIGVKMLVSPGNRPTVKSGPVVEQSSPVDVDPKDWTAGDAG
jgi:uncharacterized protein